MTPGNGRDRKPAGGGGRPADHYDVLGVPDTATAEDIARAYRRLARQHHPDHNPDAGSRRFQEITDAYGVIGDAERRRRYDAERRGGSGRGVKIPVNRGPGAGPDRPVIRVSGAEAVRGTVAVVELTEHQSCAGCGGSGRAHPPGACPDCGGAGSVTRRTGQIPVRHICASCSGRGRSAPRTCEACRGAGRVPGTHRLKVRVPAGVTDGARLRIRPKEPHPPFEAVVRVVP